METATIDGVIWRLDPDTGEVTDEIVGYESAPRDRFCVTDEDSAAWVVAKLREADAEAAGAEEAMERELQAVRNGWMSRIRRAAAKARWLRDNYADQVYEVMLPKIKRGKSVKCGAGLVGTTSKRAGVVIEDQDAYTSWALQNAPDTIQPARVSITATEMAERIDAAMGLAELPGVLVTWRAKATDIAAANVIDAPGISLRPAKEEAYIRTGITLGKSAKEALSGAQEDDE